MKLGVNVDHVATLREARHTRYPDPLAAAGICAAAGAHSITVHLREDRRHIQDSDVIALQRAGRLPLNLEMSIAPAIVRVALRVKPEEACLVPERRRELTTEGGLDVAGQMKRVRRVVSALTRAGIDVSLFIAPDPGQIKASAAAGAKIVELHTGSFCDARGIARNRELRKLIQGARLAHRLGMRVNAGHGINLANIDSILQIPHLDTLNIGHSIVSHAVMVGMKQAVRDMLKAMANYRGGRP